MPLSAYHASSRIHRDNLLAREFTPADRSNRPAASADFRLKLDAAPKQDNKTSKVASVVSDEITTLFIKNFVNAYMPKESISQFDQGLASEYWKSMFTDSIAGIIKGSISLEI